MLNENIDVGQKSIVLQINLSLMNFCSGKHDNDCEWSAEKKLVFKKSAL